MELVLAGLRRLGFPLANAEAWPIEDVETVENRLRTMADELASVVRRKRYPVLHEEQAATGTRTEG